MIKQRRRRTNALNKIIEYKTSRVFYFDMKEVATKPNEVIQLNYSPDTIEIMTKEGVQIKKTNNKEIYAPNQAGEYVIKLVFRDNTMKMGKLKVI